MGADGEGKEEKTRGCAPALISWMDTYLHLAPEHVLSGGGGDMVSRKCTGGSSRVRCPHTHTAPFSFFSLSRGRNACGRVA